MNYDNLEEFNYSVKNCIEGVVNINTGYRIMLGLSVPNTEIFDSIFSDIDDFMNDFEKMIS